MGHQNWFRILNEIISTTVNDIKKDSIKYENVNYEAFNIYFETLRKLYRMEIELNSGIHVHLSCHQGYLKNGDKNFETDCVMTKKTLDAIRRIKLKTIFDYNLRMKKIVLYLCECINGTNN